ncbi:hypothetical protein [Streptomyces collinus]
MVDVVIPKGGSVTPADAVQRFHGEWTEPVGDLVGANAEADVDAETGDLP